MVALELGNQAGAGAMLVNHNHVAAAGGRLLLRGGGRSLCRTAGRRWRAATKFRARRLRDGTCHISGDISNGTTTVAAVFATIPDAAFYPKHVCIRSGPNSTSGVVNLGINNGSGAMSFRSTGDAAGTGILCTHMGAPIN
ncbi:hypothetical protein [Bradyrhizobium cajani]|uniref:Uncharacterized protein n=1 Tax=Bradyrhizobium cajani TaxID=1928661 RepID=A0A844TCY4_9BRAD|nr:hypothetical protein [Bradyrhizobium cajani]MCP3368857.1 hypothetical protein [Bradyrhizobium cajani]MVT76903.1 hypothetical protein [Bradyrhizobium cajani]